MWMGVGMPVKSMRLLIGAALLVVLTEVSGHAQSESGATPHLRVTWNGGQLTITSLDAGPIILQRIVVNGRVGARGCDTAAPHTWFSLTKKDKRPMVMGSYRELTITDCGDVVRADVFTNRGTVTKVREADR
jgi:hypothetical protein